MKVMSQSPSATGVCARCGPVLLTTPMYHTWVEEFARSEDQAIARGLAGDRVGTDPPLGGPIHIPRQGRHLYIVGTIVLPVSRKPSPLSHAYALGHTYTYRREGQAGGQDGHEPAKHGDSDYTANRSMPGSGVGAPRTGTTVWPVMLRWDGEW